MRYILRYTQDLKVINASDTLDLLKPTHRQDFKVHICDNETGKVIWQSSKSERYGTQGVE